MKNSTYAEVVALLNGFVKNRVPPVVRLPHSPHRDFWNRMTVEQFLSGFVPNVNDENGNPLPIVIPGRGEDSPLVQALRGAKGSLFDPDTGIYPRMPSDGGPLMDNESIDALAAWINEQKPVHDKPAPLFLL